MTQTKAELLQTRHQGDIRLGDADSTNYVGFKAPATVGSNLVWTLPATDGSANQFLQTNASGVLSWGTADTSASMPLTGGTFTGDVTFTGASANIVFDKSDNALEFADNARAFFGASSDLQIYHNNHNYITSTNGDLILQSPAGNWFYVKTDAGNDNSIIAKNNGGVELYHNNVKKIETTSAGCVVTGTVTATSFSGSGANLTNLPAGGNTTDLVADGAIAAGKPCIIKSNGKVAQVQTVNSATGPQSFSEYIPRSGYACTSLCIAQALGSQWAVMAYATSGSTANIRLKAYNWSTGSSGTEITLNNGDGLDGTGKLSGLLYCTTRNKFVLSWVAAWNGTSNTQFVTFDINTSTGNLSSFTRTELGSNTRTHDIEYCGGGKFFSCHRLMSNNTARIIGPHTINSNGSITINTSELDFIAWNDGPSTHIARMEFNSDYSKFVIGYVRNSNNNAYARCGTWNGSGGAGSGITLGTELTVSTGLGGLDWQNGFDLCCEKTSGKWVAVYGMSNGSRAKCINNSSGTNLSQGSEITINSTNPDGRFGVTDNGTVENVVTWGGKYIFGFGCANLTISGTNTIAVAGGPNQINSNGPENYPISMYTCVDGIPDSGADNVLLFNRREGSSDPRAYRATVAAAGTNLSSSNHNFIGFAEDAISDGNTGTIKTFGNVVANQSGLTPGTRYKVSNDGTLSANWDNTAVGGTAIASDKLMINRDG